MQRIIVRRAGRLAVESLRGNSHVPPRNAPSRLGSPSTRRGLSSAFVAVDHSREYESAMSGGHGRQLALAELEGIGKDDPVYDPFLEEEREEARNRALAAGEVDDESDLDDEPAEAEVDDVVDDFSDEDEDDDIDDETVQASVYNKDGSIRRLKSEIAVLRAGAPAGGIFAIVELAGSQHKVTTDDVLIVNRLKPVDTFRVGSTHTLKDIMLVSSSHLTLVGMPFVTGAEVDVMVEEITKDAKVVIFKKRRRKNSDRRNGFRRDITMLRILDIRPPPGYENHQHRKRIEPSVIS